MLLAAVSLAFCGGSDGGEANPNGGPPPTEPVDPDPVTYAADVENYNYTIGTQTIGPIYGLSATGETRLVETARRTLKMGSNILKISLDPTKYKDLPAFGYTYTYEVLEREPSFKAAVEMDFRYYQFWVYSKQVDTWWRDGLSAQESQDEYTDMYKLADYLLRTFRGSGKEFFLGHWEGDWHLVDGYNTAQQTVSPVRLQGMIDWLNVRARAIADARAANPDSDVKVWHYTELNRPTDALYQEFDRIANKVLPDVDVDYVSYSSYDVTAFNLEYTTMRAKLHQVLDYIESKMVPKPGITGKRVFIGEYGYPGTAYGEATQDNYSRMVMKASLEWGCPFVLYWEMYNNEVNPDNTQKGYWLIDNRGVKQKVYHTHLDFLAAMKAWVNQFKTDNGRLPSREEFNAAAVAWF